MSKNIINPHSSIFHRLFFLIFRVPRSKLSRKFWTWYYRGILKKVGKNFRVDTKLKITNPGLISFGNNCFIGANAIMLAHNAPIVIGNNVIIAAETYMNTRNHRYDKTSIPINNQGYIYSPIVIEDDVWLGFRSIILSGVTVAKGTIVAANAVVTHNFPPFSVIAGVPAKVIMNRKDETIT